MSSASVSADASVAPIPKAYSAWFKKSMTKIVVLLGPSPSTTPHHAVYLPQGWDGELTLHAGPSIDHATIAVARWGKGLHRIIPVDLPGGDRQMVRYQGTRHTRFWFALEVAPGRVEKFEWRRSSGAAVRSLGQSRSGWKLVRCSAPPPGYQEKPEAALAADEAPEEDDNDRGDLTSDGNEIVAVWAGASLRKMSMTAVGRFEFRGAGLRGELGERWALMAVMSQMIIWRQEMQVAMAASTA